jgi:hypothetical protein
MNGYTHGGGIQVSARNTETAIEVNYTLEHVEAMMEYSCHIAFSRGVQIARVCEKAELAAGLTDLHRGLFDKNL